MALHPLLVNLFQRQKISTENMFTFNRKYFYLAIVLLLIEIFIAAYVRDVLVVVLVYCFIQSFWKIQPIKAIAGVFVFHKNPTSHSL